MGRHLAEGFIPHWQAVAADPDNPEVETGKLFTDTSKVVFSRTLTTSPWDNTSVANNLVDDVNTLKQKDGGDIITYGGSEFVSSLIQHQLIDEFHLFVNPVALGTGMPMFQTLANTQNLSLSRSQVFDCGIVLLCYQLVHNAV